MSNIPPTELTVDQYVRGVLGGDRVALARSITLIESNAPKHQSKAQEVLRKLLPYTEKSFRVGVTGIPGAGKSTLIEALGTMLCGNGHRVAVLAVDPSSTITRGSILADKTRMEQLSQHPNAFIRPSPAGGTLGGVSRKTREAMLICEAAGFDTIFIETVGVGQSEGAVRSMVDFFLLLTITGGGDELQHIKKGVVELADGILITKADGGNELNACKMQDEFNNLLHYLRSDPSALQTRVYCCSALTGKGVSELWQAILRYREAATASGQLKRRRDDQRLEWMNTLIFEGLEQRFRCHPTVAAHFSELQSRVLAGELTAADGAEQLLHLFFSTNSHSGPQSD